MSWDTFRRETNQFFSFEALTRFGRAGDAGVQYNFDAAHLYVSTVVASLERAQDATVQQPDADLRRYAEVLERFGRLNVPGVSRGSAKLLSAALYWLAGHTANALVLARSLEGERGRGSASQDSLQSLLLAFVSRSAFRPDSSYADEVTVRLRRYAQSGERRALQLAAERVERLTAAAMARGHAGEFAAGVLLKRALARLEEVSLWAFVGSLASGPQPAWRRYGRIQAGSRFPLVDLWPSQQAAVRQGVLDGRSSLLLRMPTSAGKTKLTELAFVNDLATDSRRCLYVAPFRSLVAETEAALAPLLSQLGAPVTALHGGSEVSEWEASTSASARVLIATPEKLLATQRMGGLEVDGFGTIVVDEGHLLDSPSRGAAFELMLARLRQRIASRANGGRTPRILFLSAVVPNAGDLAEWLSGRTDALVDATWQPTKIRIGLLSWARGGSPRLDYSEDDEREAFFVPRVFEQWTASTLDPGRGGVRRWLFPDPEKKAEIAAAMAKMYRALGSVLLFAAQPRWADATAESLLVALSSAAGTSEDSSEAQYLVERNRMAEFLEGQLGTDAIAARALRAGIGLHHGSLPQAVRELCEAGFRSGVLWCLVATSTVAQGVNLPVRTIVVHSLPIGDAAVRDFRNLIGRAGRAFRETEGEVCVIVTTPQSQRAARRMLDVAAVEPVISQVLRLVQAIVRGGGVLSDELLAAVVSSGPEYAATLAAIDGAVLDALVEDSAALEADGLNSLVASSLATHQASRLPQSQHDTALSTIRALFNRGRSRILSVAPTEEVRSRYSRAGVSLEGIVALEALRPQWHAWGATHSSMSTDAVAGAAELFSEVPEMQPGRRAGLGSAAAEWVFYGSYARVGARVGNLGLSTAIKYVDDTLCYRLPWVINGMLRSSEDGRAGDSVRGSVPEWMQALPQYLRYGVSTDGAVWAMSLGLRDPAFARWLVARYAAQSGGQPSSFDQLARWAVGARDELVESALGEWTRFHAELLRDGLARHSNLSRSSWQDAQD